MLGENMIMAFHAIMANKMRSFLTMLGIIIGIGSVISIVSIGDTMRGLFADLYKDAGATQAVVSIGYNVEDVRDSDYFTLDELDKIKEIFGDEISYIDSYASVNSEVLAGRTNMKFDFQGIDWNFSDVQPVTMISGRYLNEGDILGRKKNVVIEEESARKLFGTENAVGKTFRTTVYGDTDMYTVVGVYKKEMSAFQKLLSGGSGDTGSAYIPYTLLTWPNDLFYYCRLYAKEGTDMVDFMSRLTMYLGKIKNRNAEDFYTNTVADEMGSIDSRGRDRSDLSPRGRHRDYEHHAGVRHGKDPRDRYQKGAWSKDPGCPDSVPDRVRDPVSSGRNHRCSARCEPRDGRRRGAWTPRGDQTRDHPSCGILFSRGRNFLWNLPGIESRKGGSDRCSEI